MKEAIIRKKAIQQLEKDKWFCWFPKKVKFQETDVFGVYDILAVKGRIVRWIQITTLSNVSARRHKIEGFLKKAKADLPSEIWGYNKKKREFKILKVYKKSFAEKIDNV